MDGGKLIVTLTLDDAAQAFFDRLRTTYFPPDRLVVGAHVTLFHAIPAERQADLLTAIAASCARTPPFPVAVTGTRFLGRGVAYALASQEARTVRATLAAALANSLTPQDRAAWAPHITIQNKVSPQQAKQTQAALAGMPVPTPIQATGLAVWRYLGGPWQALDATKFAARM